MTQLRASLPSLTLDPDGDAADGQCETFHFGRPRRLSANQTAALNYTLTGEEPDELKNVVRAIG